MKNIAAPPIPPTNPAIIIIEVAPVPELLSLDVSV